MNAKMQRGHFFGTTETKYILAFCLGLIPAIVCPLAGHADVVCLPDAELEAALIDWHGEQPSEQLGQDIVIWTSEGGATWTMVKYHDDGTACRLESGTEWKPAQSLSERMAKSNH